MATGTKPPTGEKNGISGGVDADLNSVKTEKQQMFIAAWDGNIKTTAEKVGLSYDYCRQLVTKPHIKEALQDRAEKWEDELIADRQARQRFWTEIMRDATKPMQDRLRASELLGKSEGDFIYRQQYETGNNLAELVQAAVDRIAAGDISPIAEAILGKKAI